MPFPVTMVAALTRANPIVGITTSTPAPSSSHKWAAGVQRLAEHRDTKQ